MAVIISYSGCLPQRAHQQGPRRPFQDESVVGWRRQLALDGKHVRIVGVHFTQRLGQLDQIVAIRAAGAGGPRDMRRDLAFRRLPRKAAFSCVAM